MFLNDSVRVVESKKKSLCFIVTSFGHRRNDFAPADLRLQVAPHSVSLIHNFLSFTGCTHF